ncbi:MAG: class I SAM-dependent methyltransferase [Betaproteobacteria bacterium]
MRAPSAFIARFAYLVAHGARVLDVAAGHGRHARFFAARGARVLAVDRDPAALASLADVAGVDTLVADLEHPAWPLAGRRFGAVIVTHYLHRPRFDALLDALEPDGVLLYETFAVGQERVGRPTNPDFLLGAHELLDRVRGRLTVIAFEQGRTDVPQPAVIQRLAATGAARAWPPAVPA